MGFIKNAALAATALLALSANGHMIMKTPVPYGKSTLNNSPLDASGSDFPCKLRSGAFDAEGAQNIMQIGQPQTLSFTGSAVHGGGSCQVALTTDLEPTKSSKWMVIKSIVGGCPANVAGNLPADPNGSGASTFEFTIPDGVAPGQYTLSWSWMNKVGNREFYQNCAPATVVGSKRRRFEQAPPKVSKRQSSSFPDLCVANLVSVNSLITEEGKEYVFENGGADVQTAGQGPYQTLSCGGNGGSAAKPTASGVAQSSVSPTIAPDNSSQTFAAPSSVATNQPSGQDKPTVSSAGVFLTSSATPTLAVVPVESPSNDVPPAATAPAATGNSSAAIQSGPCTDEGAYACSSDGLSFQRCASLRWSTSIQMSAGMTCTPGLAATLDMSPSKRHLHSHRERLTSFLNRRTH